MLFLAVETTSIPLYILASFLRKDVKSTEAGLEILVLWAITTWCLVLAYYLIAGTTQIYESGIC